ncbi:MAG: hypothetical protein J0H54_12085, partial [Rhizobiales bacterium]|nr:hypothetical protein [Hyphomicrobiales bacterium]
RRVADGADHVRDVVSAALGKDGRHIRDRLAGDRVDDLVADRRRRIEAAGTSWSVGASYKHVWTPSVWTALSGGYAEYDGDGSYRGNDSLQAWRAVLGTGWTPVKGLDVLVEGSYNSVEGEGSIADGDAWAGVLWLKRYW